MEKRQKKIPQKTYAYIRDSDLQLHESIGDTACYRGLSAVSDQDRKVFKRLYAYSKAGPIGLREYTERT